MCVGAMEEKEMCVSVMEEIEMWVSVMEEKEMCQCDGGERCVSV